jgi:hypothetical protein
MTDKFNHTSTWCQMKYKGKITIRQHGVNERKIIKAKLTIRQHGVLFDTILTTYGLICLFDTMIMYGLICPFLTPC